MSLKLLILEFGFQLWIFEIKKPFGSFDELVPIVERNICDNYFVSLDRLDIQLIKLVVVLGFVTIFDLIFLKGVIQEVVSIAYQICIASLTHEIALGKIVCSLC